MFKPLTDRGQKTVVRLHSHGWLAVLLGKGYWQQESGQAGLGEE